MQLTAINDSESQWNRHSPNIRNDIAVPKSLSKCDEKDLELQGCVEAQESELNLLNRRTCPASMLDIVLRDIARSACLQP